MKKDSKLLTAEVERWNRRHNETHDVRAKCEDEARKSAESMSASSISPKHVAFLSEHAKIVDDILSFMDIDFGEDSAANAERLYQYLAEGRFRLTSRGNPIHRAPELRS